MSETSGSRDSSGRTGNEIAVIGLSGRFPGAGTMAGFWENLVNGVEAVSFFSRQELETAGIEARFLDDPLYVKARAILEGSDAFDASFFGYIPAEAEILDPQMRVFHECTWEALEDAGYDPEVFPGFIGLYAGASANFNWQALALLKGAGGTLDPFSAFQLKDKDFMTTRISYRLNLKGPSLALSTACSTSLVAVVLACQGLLIGECDMALAGGVTIPVPQQQGYPYREGLVSSPDGHCRAFAAGAAGTVSGSGAGVVLLKLLDEARAAGDHIYALVKGLGLNNDGLRKAGYTAPSIDGQTEAIQAALEMAEIEPQSIGYVETHGTATPMGDPVEIEALKMAFAVNKKNDCPIGSIKTNMGHLDHAAGIAGFIKTVLLLRHRLIPPSLHFETPNPQIDFENTPFYVNRSLTPLRPRCDEQGTAYPLRAGVSSFGIGGTNAHVILEEAPEEIAAHSPASNNQHLCFLPLSARSEAALEQMGRNLADFLNQHPETRLADVAYTLQSGRKTFACRQILVAASVAETAAALSDPGSNRVHRSRLNQDRPEPHVIFMFPGLGAQYVDMGRELYETEPVFTREMDRCFEILKPLPDYDIKEILYPSQPFHRSYESNKSYKPHKSYLPSIDHFEVAQAAVFMVEYALAKLLIHRGVKPRAMIGYSFGEYAAACISGVLSLEDALRLIVARGKCVRRTAAGMMLSVPMPRQELDPFLDNRLSLAIDNGPSVIISGPLDAVEALENRLKKEKILCLRLPGSHALHSSQMEPVLTEFQKAAANITPGEPQIPYIANVTGQWQTVEDALSPAYWPRHLRETVRFTDGMRELVKDNAALLVEVGPGRDLSVLATRCLDDVDEDDRSPRQVVPLMRPARAETTGAYHFPERLARLWLWGVPLDWQSLREEESGKPLRLSLPTYPFERQSYPVPGNPFKIAAEMWSAGRPLHRKPDLRDWFYIPLWQQSPLPPSEELNPPAPGHWLIWMDESGLGRRLAQGLQKTGQQVTVVKKGPGFSRVHDAEFILCPSRAADYDALWTALRQRKQVPHKILHLWGVGGDSKKPTLEEIDRDLDLGFYSVLYIVQALGRLGITTDMEIQVVTDHLHRVTGEEKISPQKAAVLGAVKIIPLEYTHIACRSIDILLPGPGSRQEEQLLEHLLAEFFSSARPLVAAYRGAHCWVPTTKPYPLEAPAEKPLKRLRPKGVYLVTGGLGGMGLTLAEYLAEQVRARLILTGRSPFPAREQWDQWLLSHDPDDKTSQKIIKLRHMEGLGAELIIASADVSDLRQMEAVIARAQERFGPINGVLHTAGLVDYEGVIQRRTRESTASILAPKIKGTLVLERLLANHPLDFLILFSSLGNLLHRVKFGQVGYNAANEFLDAYASYRHRGSGRFTTTINWTDWLEVGMAVSAVEKARERGSHRAKVDHDVAITPTQGKDILARVLGTRLSNIVISTQDLDQVIQQVNRVMTPTRLPGEQADPVLHKPRPRPHLDAAYMAPTSETEHRLVRIWQDFFGIESIGIRDDFFELGGDSLKAMTVSAAIHKHLGARIPLAEFFTTSDIKGLAQLIDHGQEEQYHPIPAAETKEYYSLTSAQQRLYFLQQMDPGSRVYNEPLLVVLEGPLDRQKLEQAFHRLIRRHENLRTSFPLVNEEPVQRIHTEISFTTNKKFLEVQEPFYQKGSWPPEAIIRHFLRSFDLTRAPLFRVGLIRQEERKHILMMDLHHIITDGAANDLMMGEITALYLGSALPALALRYKDYAEWWIHPRQQAALRRQGAYWLGRFQGKVPVLDLPADFPRPAIQSFAGDIAGFGIDPREMPQMKKLAADADVTLYMLLLAIYYIFLAKLSGQEDIVIGTNVSGRRHADLRHMIGLFTNTLALRGTPTPMQPFRQFLAEVKTTTLEALENQDYPFEDLVEHVDLDRDVSRNPLFDTLFSYLEVDTPRPGNPLTGKMELSFAPYPFANKTAKFDLTLNAGIKAETPWFSFEYSTQLFNPQTIQRFIKYFKKILTDLVREPHKKTAEIEIISAREKRQILSEFNDTRTDIQRDSDYPRLFAEQAGKTPDKIAALEHILGRNEQITYSALNAEANRVAHYLEKQGITPGSLVAVYLERGIDMLASIIGIFKVGTVYLPLEVDYPRGRIDYMLEDSEASLVINRDDFSPLRRGAPGFHGPPQNFLLEHQLVYMIYTSGTTGNPKGVMIHSLGMLNHLLAKIRDLAVIGEDTIAQTASACFDISIWQFLAGLLVGARICIIPKEILLEPRDFLQTLQRGQVTILESVPSLMTAFLEAAAQESQKHRALDRLRWMIPTGEPLTVSLVKEWYKYYPGTTLLNAYGPTEASDDITHYVVHRHLAETQTTIPIGKPLPNLHIYILDKHLSLCPPGIRGEICVAGIGVGKGYWKDHQKTARVFVPNPFAPGNNDEDYAVMYRTGDSGYWHEDGNIEFLGRADRQVKIRGNRIELGEIEARLLNHQGIKEAAVLAKENQQGDPYLCAYVVPQAAADLDIPALTTYLQNHLPGYMLPSFFVRLDRFPLTPSGKLDRKRLPEPGPEAENPTASPYIAPRHEIEKKLAAIWSDVLDLAKDKIGTNSHFFRLGGQSLKALRLVSQLNKHLEVKIPLVQIFKTPTLGELAGIIKRTAPHRYASITPVEAREYYPLSSAQKRLYFLQQVDEGGTAYNIPTAVSLEGTLDSSRLARSFNDLLKRHDSLRTSFHMLQDEPVQRVHQQAVELPVEYITASGRDNPLASGGNPNPLLKNLIRAFTLTRAPLLRVVLIKVAEASHILVVDLHHIITDGISREILVREFSALYAGKSLSPLKFQYKDFIRWRSSPGERETMARQQDYWKQQFQGEIPVLDLPTDYHRPALQSFTGSSTHFETGSADTEALKDLAQQEGVTLYMVLLSIYTIFLAKLSGQEDIVIGTPVTGRRHADLEQIIGMFVNTLALRNYPRGEKSLGEFLKEVKERALAAFENQDYPFEELVGQVPVNRDTGRNPLFDAAFLLDTPMAATGRQQVEKMPGLRLKPYPYESTIAKFDITLGAIESGEKLAFTIEYGTKLFKRETIQRCSEYFMTVVRQVTGDPGQRIATIEVLSPREKQRILTDLDETGVGYPREQTIHGLFARQVERTPDQVALVGKSQNTNYNQSGEVLLSYRELNEKAGQLAVNLKEKGLQPDSLVAVMMGRSLEMLIGILAILKSGGAYLPIAPDLPEERVLYILEDARVSLILAGAEVMARYSLTALLGLDREKIPPLVTAPREQIRDFNAIPFPDRSLVSYEKYQRRIGMAMATNTISLQGTRGCPYHCAYCHRIWPKTHVVRSAEQILAEVQLYYNMGIRRFLFVDDIFNLNKENSQRFFRLIIRHGLDLQLFFPNGMRGDLLSEDYIDLMVEAGTTTAAFALETASPRLQKLIGKNLDLEKLNKNLEYFCQKYPQVLLELFTMHGFPTETEEEALLTLDFIQGLKWLHFPYVHMLKIYPHTGMAALALEKGISPTAIIKSANLAFNELPATLPFEKNFSLKYQADFLNRYFLAKERLLHVLPHQIKVLTETELVQKYDSYLPAKIQSLQDLLKMAGISEAELGTHRFLEEKHIRVQGLEEKIRGAFPRREPHANALRVLFVDLSQYFSQEEDMLYNVVEPPLGLMYLMTYLKHHLDGKLEGKIVKSGIDFDHYDALHALLAGFKPDIIGLRTLTFYKDFFHKTAALVRQWGITVPIIAGGPYASSDYETVLQDRNIDLVVLGEGELTTCELMEKIIAAHKKLPSQQVLEKIRGIAFLPRANETGTRPDRRWFIMSEPGSGAPKELARPLPPLNRPTDLAYIIYTSGTTGKPKGTLIEHRNVVRLLFNDKNLFDFNNRDVWTLFHSYSFDFSVWEMYGALLYGGKLILISSMSAKDPRLFLEILEKAKVTVLNQTPAAFYHLSADELKAGKKELRLRYVIFGGEALNPGRLKKWQEKYPETQLINMYGITETTVHATYKRLTGKELELDRSNIGKPIPTLCLMVLDKDLNLLPPGIPGELWVGGKGVARGYLNRPELTAERFNRDLGDYQDDQDKKVLQGNLSIKNYKLQNTNYNVQKYKENKELLRGVQGGGFLEKSPPGRRRQKLYKTGDLVRLWPGGDLEYLGRIDRQVKIRGFRIELGEIESLLITHPRVKAATVLARETDPAADRYLYAYLVVAGQLRLPELREYLARYLPEYMIPSTFVQLEKIPLTPNGKVDRKALDLAGKRLDSAVSYTEPQKEIEKKIAGIWQEVLHLDRVGLHDNYFELGGTSLDIIKINRRLEELFQTHVPVVTMFMHTTVHALANYLLQESEELADRSSQLTRGKQDKRLQLQKRKGKRDD